MVTVEELPQMWGKKIAIKCDYILLQSIKLRVLI